MKITPELIDEAYQKTGYKPKRGIGSEHKKECCPITALQTANFSLEMSESFIMGFVTGFDDFPYALTAAFENIKEYDEGIENGRRIFEHLRYKGLI